MSDHDDTMFVRAPTATLRSLGCEQLWSKHAEEISRALAEQDDGERADGPCKFTLTVAVTLSEDGVKYVPSSKVALPAYLAGTRRGHRTYDGQLKVVDGPPQPMLPGIDDGYHDEEDLSP